MACRKKCFTFIWKLENISYYSEIKDGAILSPEFVVDSNCDRKWHLGLYPGEDGDENICIYLFRKGSAPLEIDFEIDFGEKNGSVCNSSNLLMLHLPKKVGYGHSIVVTREELFNTRRSEYLPQDTLTIRCRIWKTVGEMIKEIRCFARTRVGVQKRSFLWNVEDFSILESEQIYRNDIKSIAQDADLMSINLYLTNGLRADKTIRFEITHKVQDIKFSTLLLSLVDASGNKIQCNTDEFWHGDLTKSQDIAFSFKRNKLMEMESSYLPNDTLSLHWEWTFSKGVVSNEIEDFQYPCINSHSAPYIAEQLEYQEAMCLSHSMNDNLKSLYDEKFLCDVKLKTSTRTFDAHKIILSASSSVFKDMFSSNLLENKSNLVNIEDVGDETVGEMLSFMYSARVENLTWDKASHLYAAADKYAILNLKDICSSHLKDNLSLSNACEVLVLSELHADGDLKAATQDYIIRNMKSIVNSDQWRLLIETDGKLAAETLCLQYK